MVAAPHAKLIDAAARKYLRPLGCTQKGRSRTWLLDRGWVAFVVEFQPSAYAKGSFLNVGAHFLWTWNHYLSFDCGYRVENFVQFETEAQFADAGEQLARRAVDELRSLDEKLPSPAAVSAALPEALDRNPWVRYHRAVSRGLSGDSAEAASLFKGLASGAVSSEWEQELAIRSGRLLALLSDRRAFASAVAALIDEHRVKLGLPAYAEPILGSCHESDTSI
jgi:hypothetical protein